MYHLVTLISSCTICDGEYSISSHKKYQRTVFVLLKVSQVEEAQEFTLYISYDASKNPHFPFACLSH